MSRLWDGTGPPDPELERLEALLGPLRYDRPPPSVPAKLPWRGLPVLGAGVLLAAAAAAVLVLDAGEHAAWSCGEDCRLPVGQWLDTRDGAVTLEVPEIGTMDVSVDSRLRIVESSPEEHRVELAVGHVHAFVVAPPRLLVVDTPSARAVDLGCEYDLTVLDDGSSVLVVHTGLVELAHPDRTAIVPGGAAAVTFPGHGPGIPWWTDNPVPDYADALVGCDRGDTQALPGVLAASRPRDTLSLWHLLQRVPRAERTAVLDRIDALAPAARRDREAVLALDPGALRALFDELSADWWR